MNDYYKSLSIINPGNDFHAVLRVILLYICNRLTYITLKVKHYVYKTVIYQLPE